MNKRAVKKPRKLSNFVFSTQARGAINRIARRHQWTKTLVIETSVIATDNRERQQGLDNSTVINGERNNP